MTKKTAFSIVEISVVILLVGIIIGAITESSRLLSMSRLSNARSLTQSSPINAISDVVIWLESTAKGIFDVKNPNNGIEISLWSDANPQKTVQNDFISTETYCKPTYIIDGINHLPALHFNGACGNISSQDVSSNDLLGNGGSTFTAFIVANIHNNSGGLFRFKDSINNIYFGLANGSVVFSFPSSGSELLGAANIINLPVILTFIADSATKTIRINGAVDASGSQAGSMPPTLSNITIARMNDGGFYFALQMELGELVVFNRALNAKEIADIEKYLSKKWIIPLTS